MRDPSSVEPRERVVKTVWQRCADLRPECDDLLPVLDDQPEVGEHPRERASGGADPAPDVNDDRILGERLPRERWEARSAPGAGTLGSSTHRR